ncbi:MAG: hypothetical protein ABI778_00815 [Ignavibacteriota bacterium]
MKNIIYVLIAIGCMAASAKAQVVSKEQRNSSGDLLGITITPGKSINHSGAEVVLDATTFPASQKPDRIIKPNDLNATAGKNLRARKVSPALAKPDKVVLPN